MVAMRSITPAAVAVVILLSAGPGAAGQSPPGPAVVTKVAFGSCADQARPLPIFDAVAAQKPDLMLMLGDTIYADLDKSRKVTTDVIREKYAVLAALPGWQRLRGTCPVLGIWDDHDYGKNDAGGEWPLKVESERAFHDFYGTPADSPRRAREGVYHGETFGPEGKRVQVILLDTRYFRSPLKTGSPVAVAPYGLVRKPYVPNNDPDATFLGDAQWAWFADQLKQPADVRLVCSGIQVVARDHPFEKWANIPAERAKLFDTIRASGAAGVVILSGDRHLGELSVTTRDTGCPLYDLTASGFNQASPRWREPEVNRHRVGVMPFGQHFGLVVFDWAARTVSLQLRDEAGEVTLRHTVPIALLTPADAPDAPTGGGGPKDPPADKPKDAVKLPPGVLTPAEAVKKVGDTVTVQFTVESARAVNNGGRIFLNSDADFKAKGNFTVVVNKKAMTGKFEKAGVDLFLTKTVKATGKVTLYKDAPQIQIDEADKLDVLEAKK